MGWGARAAWAVAAVSAAAFAVQGGEYATTDLWHQRARERALAAEVDSLQHAVDSLRTLERRLRTDPALQEQVAREEFGLVRGDREILYRFADPPGGLDGPSRADTLRSTTTRGGAAW